MMIFKKAIHRREFLRGAGVALALPLLDGMIPAFASALDASKRPTRFSLVYAPNGMIMDRWTPKTEGAGFELTPTLEPLKAYRDRMVVISGLAHRTGEPMAGEGEVAPHERAGATYLTGVHPKREGVVGTSFDQIVAREFGKQTQLASLELGLDSPDIVGQCERGWSCAFIHTLSWRTPTTPNPIENQPRVVFERLFGDSDSTDPAVRKSQIEKDRTILDSVKESTGRLMRGLAKRDRDRLSEYLDAIRDVERRIHMAEEQSARELPRLDRPPGIPATFDEHAKLMFDLQLLAFQTDLTRVITFMLGREQTDRTYREIGIPDAHHPLTHHQFDPGKIAKVAQINAFHTKTFSYYLDKMRATPDGDGSLLDKTLVLYGCSLSDGNEHVHVDLPTLVVGGPPTLLKGGRHLRYPKNTPMANLFLKMLDMYGMPAENFGDSNGELDLLSI